MTALVSARQSTREAIALAFADTPPPTGTLGEYADAFFLRRPEAPVHRSASWKDITADTLLRGHDGNMIAILDALDPQTWRYYLPAWMLASLEGGEEADRIAGTTISSLRPSDESPVPFDARVEGLTPAQADAIVLFFDAVLENPFWSKGHRAVEKNEQAKNYWRDRAGLN